MSIETAQAVLGIITAVGFAVWLAGALFLQRSAQPPAKESDESVELGGNWVHDSVEVPGDPAGLSARATAVLVKESSGLGMLKILERTDDRIRFEQVGQTPANQPGLQGGELRFKSIGGGRTRIDVFLEVPSHRVLLWLGAGFVIAGLVALVVGCWAIYTFVATAPDPNLRWQTMQMLQVSHLLWPPFLFGSLYRRCHREARHRFEAMTHNLPYQ